MNTALRYKIIIILYFAALFSCSEKLVNESKPSSVGTEKDAGSEDAFVSGQKPAMITGAGLVELDFNCSTETASQAGGKFEHAGRVYRGSKLTCNSWFMKSRDAKSNTTPKEVRLDRTELDTMSFNWSVNRKFGSFYEAYQCVATWSDSKPSLVCFFQEVNLAAKVEVSVSVSRRSGLALTADQISVQKPVEFRNDCAQQPSVAVFNAFGSGARENPYVICNKTQLENLRSEYLAGRVPNAMHAYYRIGQDLGLFTETQMIGDRLVPFSGVIQGNGYSFSLDVDVAVTSDADLVGLVKYADGATIGYFTIKEFKVTGRHDGRNQSIGALVGYAKDSYVTRITLEKVIIDVSLSNSGARTAHIASLVGVAENSVVENVRIDSTSIRIEARESRSGFALAGLVGLSKSSSVVRSSTLGQVSLSAVGEEIVSMAGVVGQNSDRSSTVAMISLKNLKLSGDRLAGAVYTNVGVVDQIKVEVLDASCRGERCEVSGIASLNQGTISKTSVVWSAERRHESTLSISVAGLVGLNGGLVSDVVVLGKFSGVESELNPSIVANGMLAKAESSSIVRNAVSAVDLNGLADTTNAQVYGVAAVVLAGATFESSYWNRELSQSGTPDSQTGALTGVFAKTTLDLQTQSTFSGFDFQRVWMMPVAGYPSLR